MRYHTMDLAYSSADWGIFSPKKSSRGHRVWYRENHVLHIAEAGNFEPFERILQPAKGCSTPASLMCEMSDAFQSKALEKSPLADGRGLVRKRWYRGFQDCRPEGREGRCSTSRTPLNGRVKELGHQELTSAQTRTKDSGDKSHESA